ncbi:MAG TPA: VWA domain-containing protein [Bryobacteraceae bacterium]|nr:VWA domain-containing protein [Bryobacteraceae bacterium]
MRTATRNPREKGVTLIIGTLSLLFIIPMMGLAVDVGFLYSIKSKLQASVDGASLAAARALSIGSSLSSQTTSAQNNAVTWFNANFPSGYFGTYNTVMGTGNVQVFAGTGNQAQVRNVTVTATTTVDTFFMRWLGFGSTTISASGNASRRTVVAMLVLDRSGSMCAGGSQPCKGTGNSLPCSTMVSAAKMFTGQFAEGSDYIGLVSFSDNVYVHSAPVQNFQTVLGYSNASGSAAGLIDTIGCYGGTSTAEGLSMAYQLLYQTNLPGALNVLMLETDGLPNTLAMNFWDNANTVAGLTATSGCKDTASKTMAGGGFKTAGVVPSWTTGVNMSASPFLTSNSYYSNIPAGMIATVSSDDPGDATLGFWAMLKYWTTSVGTTGDPFNSFNYTGGSGCASDGQVTKPTDIGWFPSTDIFGNQLNPSGYTYETVATDAKGHITQSGSNPGNWTNYHKAVLNATDNAAYNFRSNATIPAMICTIGLGGNSAGGPPDPVLLQRMANDPNGDEFNTTGPDNGGYYWPCANASEHDSYGATCTTYPSPQPQGTFIYAPNSTYLAEAFLRVSSQVLRLSK